MDINAAKVKQYRTQLGWTQQTLADACDLSIRTIQRVERYGVASNETVMSLCAVFEIEQNILIIESDNLDDFKSNMSLSIHPIALALISVLSGALVGGVLMYLMMK